MADKKISALTAASTPLAGTEVLPIVQSGATVKVSVANLTAGRAVAMAGGSFTDNITQSTAAKGIDFTANTPAAGMTSELLNWYEEGTFTPTISSGITSVTYSTQNGAYTRIGRLVTFALRLELSAGTAAAAIVQIGGLPFTANISFRGYAGSWAYAAGNVINSLSTNLPTLNVDAGSTTISFYNTQGAAFNGTDLSTAANFSVDLCGMYYA